LTKPEQTGADGEEESVRGSVVYMGRGSFRMETIFTDPEPRVPANDGAPGAADDDGAPREITGIVTSPYGVRSETPSPSPSIVDEDATELIGRARAGTWRTPEPSPLFGSQDEVPLLAAPTGRIAPPRRRGIVVLSRGTLAAAGILFFACGLASGAVARRAARGTRQAAAAPLALEKKEARPAPLERTGGLLAGNPSALLEAQVIPVPEPVLIRARKKPAAMPAHVAPRAGHATAARWIDPFAD
jgi:hypothetical protein